MTESDWLACADPLEMLAFLRRRGSSERKLRLFDCACCRRAWPLMTDTRSRTAVEVAERFADGIAGRGALEVATEAAFAAVRDARDVEDDGVRAGAERAAQAALMSCWDVKSRPVVARSLSSAEAAWAVAWGIWYATVAEAGEASPVMPDVGRLRAEEAAAQADLLRCIFDDPASPVVFDPSWRTTTVVALARAMYETRDFCATPILADALQDAGCDNEGILAHCRSSQTHVRGCFLIDAVLGLS